MSVKFDFSNLFGISDSFDIAYKNDIDKISDVHLSLTNIRQETTWRDLPYTPDELLCDIEHTANNIRERFDAFVVLGIGGSALGAKALFKALAHPHHNELDKSQRNAPRFYILDNIDPDSIAALFDIIDPKKTCFNVISKSGTTIETMSQFIYVFEMLKSVLGEHFCDNIIITTDSEKGVLNKINAKYNFKKYIIPKGTGGRFSVLCPVGLLPAAVLGIDIRALLNGAKQADKAISANEHNPAYLYAAAHVAAMKCGINISVMLPYSDALSTTAEWYAQIWAESLGKAKTIDKNAIHCGQTPVKAVGTTDQHSQLQLYVEGPSDKIICFIGVEEFENTVAIPNTDFGVADTEYLYGKTFNQLIASEMSATKYALKKSEKFNMQIIFDRISAHNMGILIYTLEIATAAAGQLLNINPYDQPGVEEGKIATFAFMGIPEYKNMLDDLIKESEKFKLLIEL